APRTYLRAARGPASAPRGYPAALAGRFRTRIDCRSWSCPFATNKKGHHRYRVMALESAGLVEVWLHHPVRVGRLMPTLIRTRLRPGPRNMSTRLGHTGGHAPGQPAAARISAATASRFAAWADVSAFPA